MVYKISYRVGSIIIIMCFIFLLVCTSKAYGEVCHICRNETMDCWIDDKGVIYCKNELIQYPADSLETSYIVDKRCRVIGESAFSGNRGLKAIVIQDGVSIIENSAFACTNIESIELPESLLVIADLAFMNCHQLKSVSFPSKLYAIGYGAFLECPLSIIKIPASVQFIDSEAFSKTKVTDVYFEDDSFYTVDAPFRNNDHVQIVFHFPVFDADEESPHIERLIEFYDRLKADFCVSYDIELYY